MHAYLHCLSHSPLVGYVDPAQEVLDEVNGVIASARERIAAFSPELQWLGEPVVHLHTVRNGKIDPALHDGMRTGLRQLHRHGQLSCRTAEITNCRRSNA